MIEITMNRHYFEGLAIKEFKALMHNSVAKAAVHVMIDFANKYNCKIHTDYDLHDTLICSEEDFLIIKLTEPNAIESSKEL